MKKIFFSLALFALASFAYAQGKFEFKTMEHDFGTFMEGRMAEYAFEFTNTGTEPIIISNVKASCGCTTPDWTRTPIAPGEKGVIKAVYNSKNRPGPFTKDITVTSNAMETTVRLRIKGVVERDPNSIVAPTTVPADQPEVAFVKNVVNFGKIEIGQKIAQRFEFTNTGKVDLTGFTVSSVCNCVTIKSASPTVKVGEKGYIEIIYSPKVVKDLDEIVHFKANTGKTIPSKVVLQGKVVESLAGDNMLIEKKNTNPFGGN